VFTATFVFIGAVVYMLLAPKGREDPATLQGRRDVESAGESAGEESLTEELADDLLAAAKGSGILAAVTVAGEHEAEDADRTVEVDEVVLVEEDVEVVVVEEGVDPPAVVADQGFGAGGVVKGRVEKDRQVAAQVLGLEGRDIDRIGVALKELGHATARASNGSASRPSRFARPRRWSRQRRHADAETSR
jgi:hypothetical protein